jgi:type IV secretory pathway TrbL component
VGILFLVIGYTAHGVYKNRIQGMLLSSINVRIIVVFTIVILAYLSSSLFLYILAGIIMLGVIGSAYCYYNEYVKIGYSRIA